MNGAGSLPDPDPAALERSAELAALIRAEITAAAGAIGFDRYMEMALYQPGLGYYAAGETIFGGSGDFVTAPESGTLFARCMQRQCAEILSHGGTRIVEYGAGSGRLAALLGQALLADEPRLSYHLVEPSASLRARQRALLAAQTTIAPARLSWSETHPDDAFSGVVLANEVVDAMPARRYQVSGGSVQELGVGIDGEHFVWRVLPGRAVPGELAAALRGYPDGYRCERHPGLRDWCRALRGKLCSGVVLISDYGYACHEYLHPDRSDGTLKCHYRHHVHADPFFLPGVQDLTVAVDFTDLAEAAHAAGFRVAGFTTQARFLLACGIDAILAEAGAALDVYELAQEAKRLLLPGEMGQTCKFMALAVDYDAPLSGFAADERHRLGGFASD
ncbi:MAG: SAM-dependent methyltransferase [Gammaproteobacteria bacterium]